MEDALSLAIYFLATFLLIYFAYKWKSPSFRYKLPPGPFAWPIVGNYSLLTRKNPIQYLSNELRQQYGDVIMMYMGSFPSMLVNNYELAVDALVNKYPTELAGRPKTYLTKLFSEGYNDILMADYGPRWKMHRKIAHSALRQFAQGKHLLALTERAFDKFKRNIDADPLAKIEGINPYERLYFLSYNIMCSAVYGADYEFEDTEFKWLRSRIEEANRIFLEAPYLDYIPGVQYLPLPPIRRFNVILNDLISFFNDKIKEHKETLPEAKDDLRDITDYILMEERNYIAEEDERLYNLQHVHIRQTLLDIFGAGTDTTAFTLNWIVGLLSTHPEVQQKCYDEIQANLTFPLESFENVKRENLPYADATLHEVMRYGLLIPLGFQHTAMADCKIGDFDVPKGTMVFFNQYCFAFDPKYWDNPHTFDPERFLDENGKLAPKKSGFMPFSCGRRVCLGEIVAKTDLFVLTVALLSEYNLVWSEENTVAHVEEKGEYSFIRELKPYKVKFVSRN